MFFCKHIKKHRFYNDFRENSTKTQRRTKTPEVKYRCTDLQLVDVPLVDITLVDIPLLAVSVALLAILLQLSQHPALVLCPVNIFIL